jgi:hypothetical protein
VVTRKCTERLPRSIVQPLKDHHIAGVKAVALGDNGEKLRAIAAYTSTLPSDFHQTLRLSLTKSLAQYYAPLEEIPPAIRELLKRLDEQK